ncbi:ABC transporter permease [Cellulomonas rhizosphaerae]|uniref:ABC transporter permease n=1 Tax=Cellulomonas rhizosphaerae TaxID=2293719 RepID=A0A413RRZ8_9CELL|nr:ABC transporter permease [Cellulomonas rhizosphaerae]RHA44671.1 ABC transporter permease [Cellulomonas rhizosphaerae]
MSATSLGSDAPVSAVRRLLRHLLFSEYLVLYLSVLYFVAVLPLVPEMASAEVLGNILSDMLPLLVVAIGQTFVLIVAGIDLSVTSVLAMASVVGASVMTGDGGYLAGSALAVPGAMAAMLTVGLAIGAFNGLCITRFGMPAFIVTLTTMMFFSGAAIWYTTFHTETSSIANLPAGFVALGQGSAGGLPNALWVVLAVGVAAHLLLARTVLGRRLYACGQNRRAAAVSGVPVPRVVLAAFVISGGCAAVASILYTGRLETGTPILGQAILLDIIGAVVIGGTSLFGGKGKVLWTLFGVLFLVLIDTSLKMLGMSLFSVFAIKGAVILLAAVIDALRTRFAARL